MTIGLVPFDPNRPYGTLYGATTAAKYEQEGRYYTQNYTQCNPDGTPVVRPEAPPTPEPPPVEPAEVRSSEMYSQPQVTPQAEEQQPPAPQETPQEAEIDIIPVDLDRCTTSQLKYLMERFGQEWKNKRTSVRVLKEKQAEQERKENRFL